MRPTKAPVIDFIAGAGPDEPQIDFKIDQLKLEFFIEVDRRWIRAFATVDVGMKLQMSPERNEEDLPILVVQVAEGATSETGSKWCTMSPFLAPISPTPCPLLLDVVLFTFLTRALVFPVDLAGPLSTALGTPVDASIDHVMVRGEEGDELALYATMRMVETSPQRFVRLPDLRLATQASPVQLEEQNAWVDLASLTLRI